MNIPEDFDCCSGVWHAIQSLAYKLTGFQDWLPQVTVSFWTGNTELPHFSLEGTFWVISFLPYIL